MDDDEYEMDEVMMTKWQQDEHSLGSYCYFEVGTTKDHLIQLSKPIDDRFWFVGEHTNSEAYAFAHGAYDSGVMAAKKLMRIPI